MAIFSRLVFAWMGLMARKGLVTAAEEGAKAEPRRTGFRGEAYAYWYLRRHGYVMVARNYTAAGLKGEIDLVGYDGPVVAFIEVKTRGGAREVRGLPEDAITSEKRRNLVRMAKRFLMERRLGSATCRFDVLAIESSPGQRPVVRLHKDAFAGAG